MDFSVTVPESISITLPSTAPAISFTTIDTSGTFGYTAYSVSVGMNIARRYSLSMYSTSTSSTASDLVSGSNTLSTLSSAQTVSSLSTGAGWTSLNKWGYALGTTSDASWTFNGVSGDSSNATIIHNYSDSTAQVSNGITTNIILGTKVDLTQAEGDYATTLNFIAITEPPKFSGITTMQAMTPEICSAAAENESAQLIDTRDNKLYWVTKLADGNCWMTQNLDYDIKTSDNIVALTSDGSATTWSSDYAPQATTSSIFSDETRTGTYSYDPGSYYLPGGSGTATAITCTSSSNGGENCHYHLGNYYQYNAITAGTGGMITDAEATASICPVGWRLPTKTGYTNTYSFGKLTNAYNITNSAESTSDAGLLVSPLWFTRAGRVNRGGLYNQGEHGFVWSSTASASTYYALFLSFSSTYLDSGTGGSYNRYDGLSARCVAVGSVSNISEVTTMQQFGSLSSSEKTAVLSSMTTGTAYSLTDTRDNETYYVAKLADGNVWMLDNLRLGGDSAITLTSSDSNVSSSYTLPAPGSWSDSYTNSYINADYKNTTTTSYGDGSGKIGVYYNYCAASAGTICTESNSSNASYDICPKDWRLPTSGDSGGEFQALYTAYSDDVTTFRSALSTPLSGRFGSRSAYVQGSNGYFWSSTCYYSTSMYRLNVTSSDVGPAGYGNRNLGLSIRCVGNS